MVLQSLDASQSTGIGGKAAEAKVREHGLGRWIGPTCFVQQTQGSAPCSACQPKSRLTPTFSSQKNQSCRSLGSECKLLGSCMMQSLVLHLCCASPALERKPRPEPAAISGPRDDCCSHKCWEITRPTRPGISRRREREKSERQPGSSGQQLTRFQATSYYGFSALLSRPLHPTEPS